MLNFKNIITKQKRGNRGFTLLELLITILVIIIGIVGVYMISAQIISYSNLAAFKLTASYFGQEGIEIVKNMRETNFIRDYKSPSSDIEWDQGLTVCENGCEADYNADYKDNPPSSYEGKYLNIQSNGFYGYDSGTPTKFKRKITITKVEPIIMRVVVTVDWQEKSKPYSIVVQEDLYKWYDTLY